MKFAIPGVRNPAGSARLQLGHLRRRGGRDEAPAWTEFAGRITGDVIAGLEHEDAGHGFAQLPGQAPIHNTRTNDDDVVHRAWRLPRYGSGGRICA